MHLDVVDLRSFYASPLGIAAQRYISAVIKERWGDSANASVLGIGYATPYLGQFREAATRTLAFMPAEQGVVNWPSSGATSTALIETALLPLPDACIDRIFIAHLLEVSDQPRELLGELWRILTPGGRLMILAPNRAGLWSRADWTPFGHGQPYSRAQLRDIMKETLFSPIYWGEALYSPPFSRALLFRYAPFLESFSRRISMRGAGVLIVEATKQLYRPVSLRRTQQRILPLPEPVFIPGGAAVSASSAIMLKTQSE